ncbi:MAG: organic solvent tolerance protein OstA [Marinifilaceae bacterium]|jgi:lipopolysaccharide export system protein LptA|nr:organic solvent tolerance protein OstA [Marinifilaceae bacterium]
MLKSRVKLSFLIAILLLINLNIVNAQSKKTKVKIINSDKTEFYPNTTPPISKFIGNVVIHHNKMVMHCDSVYHTEVKNSIEAFGDIHIINADTVHIRGKYLQYDGNTGIGKLRDDIKLNNDKIILTSNFLDFDMNTNVGYYYGGGQIVDSTNVLTSDIGRYYTNDNLLFFKDSVKLVNPNYTLNADTLKYNTESKTAYITGPTTMKDDDNTFYSEKGWYNTINKKSRFQKNNTLTNKSYIVVADTILSDPDNAKSEMINNISVTDTTNNVILKGHYSRFDQNNEKGFLTDSVLMLQIYEKDTLFLHCDTVRFETTTDSIKNRRIKAYYKVKAFRKDFQARCDSMVYSLSDSTLTLFNEPVLWAQGNQFVADTIKMIMENREVKYMHFRNNAFLTNHEDTVYYNQVKGRNMLAHVKENKVEKIDIKGNGETLYYPKDKEELMGMNLAKSSDITIFMKNKQIESIQFIKKPDGNMNPLFKLDDKMIYLKDFQWLEYLRPKSKEEIFENTADSIQVPLRMEKAKSKVLKAINKKNIDLIKNLKNSKNLNSTVSDKDIDESVKKIKQEIKNIDGKDLDKVEKEIKDKAKTVDKKKIDNAVKNIENISPEATKKAKEKINEIKDTK